jgi:hypothetical protein
MNAPAEFTTFVPVTSSMRQRLEATIDNLIALLDEIDGDPDRESTGDDEPILGWPDEWTGRGAQPLRLTGDDDRELESEHDEDGGDAEPDSDGESGGDEEPDSDYEPEGNDEPNLGWRETLVQGLAMYGPDTHDRELETR